MDFVPSFYRIRSTLVEVERFREFLRNPTRFAPILDRFKMNVGFIIKTKTKPYVCINFANVTALESKLFQVLFSQAHYVQEADGDWIYFNYYLSSTAVESYNDQRMFYYEQNKDRFQQIHDIPALFSSQLTYLTNVAYYTAAATGDYFALYRVGINVLTPLNEITETQWYQFYATQFTTIPVYALPSIERVFAPPTSRKFVTSVGAWNFNASALSLDDTSFGQATIYVANQFRAYLDLYLVATPAGVLLTPAISADGNRENAYNASIPNIGNLIAAVNNEQVISNFTAFGFAPGAIGTKLSSVSQVTTNLFSWLASIADAYNFQFSPASGPYPSSYPALVPIATMKKITDQDLDQNFTGMMNSMSCDWTDTFKQYEIDRRCALNQFSFPILRSIFNGPQTFDSAHTLIRTGNSNVIQALMPETISNYVRMEVYPFDLSQDSEFVKLRVQGIDDFALDTQQFSKTSYFIRLDAGAVPNGVNPPAFPTTPQSYIDLGVANTDVSISNEILVEIAPLALRDWSQNVNAGLDNFLSNGFTGAVKGPLINSAINEGEEAAWISLYIPWIKNDKNFWTFLIPLDDYADYTTARVEILYQTAPVGGIYGFETINFTSSALFQQVAIYGNQRFLSVTYRNNDAIPLAVSSLYLKVSIVYEPWQGSVPETIVYIVNDINPNIPLYKLDQIFPVEYLVVDLAVDKIIQVATANLYDVLIDVVWGPYQTFLEVRVNEDSTAKPIAGTVTWALESWIEGVSKGTNQHFSGSLNIATTLFDPNQTPLIIDISSYTPNLARNQIRFSLFLQPGYVLENPVDARSISLSVNLRQVNLPNPPYYIQSWPSTNKFSYNAIVTQWPFTLRATRSALKNNLIVSYAISNPNDLIPNVNFPLAQKAIASDTLGVWYEEDEYYYFTIPLPQNAPTAIGLRMWINMEYELPPIIGVLDISYTTVQVTTDPANTIFSFNAEPIYIPLPLTKNEMNFWGQIFLDHPTSIQFYIELDLALVGGKRDYIWSQFSEFTAIAMKEGDNANASTMMVLTDNAENYGYQSSQYSILYANVDANQRYFWQKFLQRPVARFLTTLSPIKLLNFDIWDYKLRRTLILFFR
jgi:hypothetical protein